MITRRFFILGSAAAVAAVHLSVFAAMHLPGSAHITSAVLSPEVLGRRLLDDVAFGVSDLVLSNPLDISLSVAGRDGSFLHLMLPPWGLFRWRASPGNEIVLLDRDVLQIEVSPDPGPAARLVIEYEDARGERFEELFTWVDGAVARRERVSLGLVERRVYDADHGSPWAEDA